jgi:ABC-type transporter Mla subunit MlaD
MRTLERASKRLGVDPRALGGFCVLLGSVLIWALTFTGAIPSLFQGHSRAITADFGNIQDIVPNDPVRIDGVQVGQVGGSSLDRGARSDTLTLKLDSNAPPIYNDATAAIRWRTALGANDSVTINPGTRSSGLLGGRTIPLSQTSNQVELDEITASLRNSAQSGLRTMLRQLGPAFADHVAPARLFGTLAAVAPVITTGVGAVRGQIPDTDLMNLVKQAGAAASAFDVGAGASVTQRFVQSAATTLAATGASHADISATIADAGAVLPRTTQTAASVDHTLTLIDPLIAKLNPVAPSVAPTLSVLHPALVHLNTLLSSARPLLHSLRPAVESLASTASVGVPVIDALSPSLTRIDTQILPGLDWVSPESKHTTYQMIGGVFVGFTDGGLGVGFNRDGYYGRLLGSGSQNSVTDFLPCKVMFSGATLADFLSCETLMAVLNQYFTPGANLLGPTIQRVARLDPKLAAGLMKGVSNLGKLLGHR